MNFLRNFYAYCPVWPRQNSKQKYPKEAKLRNKRHGHMPKAVTSTNVGFWKALWITKLAFEFFEFSILCVCVLERSSIILHQVPPSETEVRCWLIKKNVWYTWSTCGEHDYSQIMDYNGVFYSSKNSKASWTDHYNVHGAETCNAQFCKKLIYAPHATGPCKIFLVREVMMAATPFIFVTRLFFKLHHACEWWRRGYHHHIIIVNIWLVSIFLREWILLPW